MFGGFGLDMVVAPLIRAIVPGLGAMQMNDPNDQTNVSIVGRELLRNRTRKVQDAQKCVCPMEGRSYAFLFGYGIGHEGLIVTLDDGETKYLIHKLPLDENEGTGDTIVTYLSNMGQTWRKGDTKKILSSTLSDYLEACGDRYVLHSDDCRHAVQRMWALS